mmetsp:Transcript_10353/g.15902  ORF Transcript_10353/g.15902 Transcript_10353/m.15902 type:complete len:258 (+) Transcript_10353:77-850(+)
MNSWSVDSGDTSLVTIDIAGDFHKNSSSKFSKVTDESNETDTRSTTDSESIETITGLSPPSTSIQCCHVSQCYHIAQSTEIYFEDHKLFEIPNEHRIIRFRFGVRSIQKTEEDAEHDVALHWNIRTGERNIYYNRIIMQTTILRGFRVCDQTILTPQFSLRLLSCIDNPLGAAIGFQTSELIVNGVSCYDLPTMASDGVLVQPRGRPILDHRKKSRKSFQTVGEILCPEIIEMSQTYSMQKDPLQGIDSLQNQSKEE